MKILNNMVVFVYSRRGAITPFLLFMIIIMLMFAMLSLYTSMAFYTRSIARNSFDAATFSAILSSTRIEYQPKYYIYDSRCSKYGKAEKEGDPPPCIQETYFNVEGDRRAFIYLDEYNADNVFRAYLEDNIELNVSDAEVISTNFEVLEYDSERYIDLYKDRPLNRENTDSCIYQTTNPHSWWFDYDFKGLTVPPAWNGNEDYEERTIRWDTKPNHSNSIIDGPVPFPRWVRAKATAKVRVHLPYGNFYLGGGRDIIYNFEQEIVRELLENGIAN
jgi:hypothetical protein